MDSSYCNKNKNRAPITFLTTVDENSWMLPGKSHSHHILCLTLTSSSSLLDITGDTLAEFLDLVKAEIRDMAEALIKGIVILFHLLHCPDWCAGGVEVEHGLEEFSTALMQGAKIIVDSDVGWVVGFFMIDKCHASIQAI